MSTKAQHENSVPIGTADSRGAPRKSVRSGAMLRFESNRPQIYCSVHDVSSTGARVQLQGVSKPAFGAGPNLPETFKLVIPNDRIEVDCKLAWERGTEVGVIFRSAFRPIRLLGKKSQAGTARQSS